MENMQKRMLKRYYLVGPMTDVIRRFKLIIDVPYKYMC